MYKLLNENARREVMGEYSSRRLVVALSALLLVSVLGVIGLLPSYLLSNARFGEVVKRSEIRNSAGAIKGEDNPRASLEETNRRLSLLDPSLDTDKPSLLMEKFLAERQSGISVENFLWRKIGESVVLTISGKARDRQTLVSLENRVNASGNFSKVVLPISNLAKDKEIDFQLSLSPLTADRQN